MVKHLQQNGKKRIKGKFATNSKSTGYDVVQEKVPD